MTKFSRDGAEATGLTGRRACFSQKFLDQHRAVAILKESWIEVLRLGLEDMPVDLKIKGSLPILVGIAPRPIASGLAGECP